ncbi:MAG: GNAT family N-acetyltransferase, partial [Eudoraea sp.]|uniref:GNAT family N-acetyltransferase n=1 Tax=Eudoraea sp. TaxID=1979955 RepID=UPI003C775E82
QKMIIKRFQQRNQENDALKKWEDIQSTIYDLIISKKASLFVIYHNKKALAISLSYHFNNVFFYYIPSYDLDYSKFGLGNIMIYKQLEWCIAHDYRYFDMGWGYLDYKRRWCNYIHTYDNHLIFSKTSIIVYLMSIWEGNKTRLKAYLLSGKLKTFFDKTKSLFIVKVYNNNNYSFQNLGNSTSLEGLIQLDLDNEKNFHFKIIQNDFIYYTEEYYSDVKLYRGSKQDFFIIKGRKHCKKIVFKP